MCNAQVFQSKIKLNKRFYEIMLGFPGLFMSGELRIVSCLGATSGHFSSAMLVRSFMEDLEI